MDQDSTPMDDYYGARRTPPGASGLYVLKRDWSNFVEGGFIWTEDIDLDVFYDSITIDPETNEERPGLIAPLGTYSWKRSPGTAPGSYWSETGILGAPFYYVIYEDTILADDDFLSGDWFEWPTFTGTSGGSYDPAGSTDQPPADTDSDAKYIPYNPDLPTEPVIPADRTYIYLPQVINVYLDGQEASLIDDLYYTTAVVGPDLLIGDGNETFLLDEFRISLYNRFPSEFTPAESEFTTIEFVEDITELNTCINSTDSAKSEYIVDIVTYGMSTDQSEFSEGDYWEWVLDVYEYSSVSVIYDYEKVTRNSSEIYDYSSPTNGYDLFKSPEELAAEEEQETTDEVTFAVNEDTEDLTELNESTDTPILSAGSEEVDVTEESVASNLVAERLGYTVDISDSSSSEEVLSVRDNSNFVDIDQELPLIEVEVFTGAYIESTLPELTSSVHSVVSTLVDIASALPKLTTEAYTGAVIEGTLEVLTGTIEAYTSIVGVIQQALPLLDGSIDAYTAVQGAIEGELPRLNGSIEVTTAISASIQADIVLLDGTVEALVGAYSFIRASLPGLSGDITSTATISVDAEATLPVLESSVEGLVSVLSDIEGVLPLLVSELSSTSDIRGALSGTFTALEAHTSVIVSSLASIEGTLEVLQGGITANVSSLVTISSVLPFIRGSIEIVNSTIQTYCMCLNAKNAVSTFTNYDFNSYAIINGKPVASNTQGLYLLENSTDDGTKIPVNIEFPFLNFGTYLPKKIYGLQVGGSMQGKVISRVTNGSKTWEEVLTFARSGNYDSLRGYFTHATRGDFLKFSLQSSDFLILNNVDLYLQILER